MIYEGNISRLLLIPDTTKQQCCIKSALYKDLGLGSNKKINNNNMKT